MRGEANTFKEAAINMSENLNSKADLKRIIESAKRLGFEMDEADAL